MRGKYKDSCDCACDCSHWRLGYGLPVSIFMLFIAKPDLLPSIISSLPHIQLTETCNRHLTVWDLVCVRLRRLTAKAPQSQLSHNNNKCTLLLLKYINRQPCSLAQYQGVSQMHFLISCYPCVSPTPPSFTYSSVLFTGLRPRKVIQAPHHSC